MDEKISYAPSDEKRINRRIWLALAVFAVISAAAAALFILLTPNPLAEKSSVADGNTYTNTALNITCTVPDGWTAPDEDTIRSAMAQSEEKLGAKADTESTKILMLYQDPRTGGYVQLTCSYVEGISPEEALKAMSDSCGSFAAAWAPDGDWSVSQPYAVALAGYEWQAERVQLHSMAADVYFLTMVYKDYMCSITAVGLASESPVSYLDFFSSAG